MKKTTNESDDFIGTCWGGGFFDTMIKLSEQEGVPVLLICKKTAKICRYICSNDIASAKIINENSKACIQGKSITVKKYVLTLIYGKVLVCTVIKGNPSNNFEKIVFGEW